VAAATKSSAVRATVAVDAVLARNTAMSATTSHFDVCRVWGNQGDGNMDTQRPVHKVDSVIVDGRSLRGLAIVGGDGVPDSHRQGDMPVKQKWKDDCCGVGTILLTAGYCVRTSPWTDDCYVGEMSLWTDERHPLPAGRHGSLLWTAVDHAT